MDSHVQCKGPGCPPNVDDPGQLPTSSHYATAKALTQGKLTIETVSQATETLSSYISALDDQGWDVKQEVLSEWLEEEGPEEEGPKFKPNSCIMVSFLSNTQIYLCQLNCNFGKLSSTIILLLSFFKTLPVRWWELLAEGRPPQ